MLRRALVPALVLTAVTAASARADAHFSLQEPPNWESEDALGSPQKQGPCGDEGGGTPTGIVTAFQEGDTITVTIDEKIFHPGHYRIALAVHDRSELPAEPMVTPGADSPCGSVPIQDPPVFPVLADGVWVHTSAFTAPQSTQITLPAGVTCDHCTLQVIEFMSEHPLNNPGGCFYHHCANVAIQSVAVGMGGAGGGGGASGSGSAGKSAGGSPGGGSSTAGNGSSVASTPPSSDSAASGGDSSSSGGCVYSPGRAGALGWLVMAALALSLVRRRDG